MRIEFQASALRRHDLEGESRDGKGDGSGSGSKHFE